MMYLIPLVPWLGLLAVLVLADRQEPYILSGVPIASSSTGVPLRKEISELQAQGGAQWDVYIRALAAMQTESHSEPLSYFQVAGIHGKPFIEWNGAGEKKTNEWQGYCPHGEQLFLPWHRSFVLVFEQVLVENAKRIAQQYPQRYRYQYIQAAETLRSPYWDWAANTNVPSATVPEKVRVNVPKGQHLEEVEIDNPLFTFKFSQDVVEGEYGHFDDDNRTQIYRCPSPNSYPKSANDAAGSRPYKQWIYDAFTHAENFSEFASTRDGGISLEQVHNGIHWDGACGGQFLASEYSGFDPLFMLHHTNVDRLWAYWQAIHPDHASFRRPYRGGSRFATPAGTVIGPDSPLQPFYKSDDKFHSPRSVEKISAFGYTYQSLEYWDKSEVQMGAEAKRLVNQLYGPTDLALSHLAHSQNKTITRFFARVQLEVSEVERPCILEVYIAGQHAGNMFVMEHPARGASHAGFALDEQVLEASGMQRRSVRKTLDLIQSSLEVAIIKADGHEISISSVPSLRIEIEEVVVEAAETRDELPIYGFSRRHLANATQKDADHFI